MRGFGRAFRWGEKPPKWLLKEFSRALEFMGKRGEVAHAFDTGGGEWSFVVMVVRTDKMTEMSQEIKNAFEKVYGDTPSYGSHTPET